MPRRKTIPSLKSLCTDFIAHNLFSLFKDETGKKKTKATLALSRIRNRSSEFLDSFPVQIQKELFESFVRIVVSVDSRKNFLAEDFYRCANIFINERTEILRLESTKFFQDSSDALEAFLEGLNPDSRLTEIRISRQVMDLICFDLVPVLRIIGSLKELKSISLPGLNLAEIEDMDMMDFLELLTLSCTKLRHLDLRDSCFGNEHSDYLKAFGDNLTVLRLDQCPRLGIAAAARILPSLPNLVQFDCDNHLPNIAGLESNYEFGRIKLSLATIRDMRGLKKLAQVWPQMGKIKIIYNDFEIGGNALNDEDDDEDGRNNNGSSLDAAFGTFKRFNPSLKVDLDMNGTNLLLPIEMKQLRHGGQFVRRLVLTQCEFLHPRTLDPWSKYCPNLAELAIYNCGEISDEMFIGDAPDLDSKPFSAMKSICFEGNALSESLLSYLFKSSTSIIKIVLNLGNKFPGNFLQSLAFQPRRHLKELYLNVDRVNAHFGMELDHAIESSPNLERLEIFARDEFLRSHFEAIERRIERQNWEMKFLYHIRARRTIL